MSTIDDDDDDAVLSTLPRRLVLRRTSTLTLTASTKTGILYSLTNLSRLMSRLVRSFEWVRARGSALLERLATYRIFEHFTRFYDSTSSLLSSSLLHNNVCTH